MFYGIIIYMYWEINGKHKMPHIHATYQGQKIVISLDGTVLEGELPTKKLRMVQAWMDIHEEELKANWELAQEGQTLFRIEPLH